MLEARILKALCKAIGPNQSLSTQYGGLIAISLFGANAINAFLLPLAMTYWKKWESMLEKTTVAEERLQLQMCQQAVLVSFEFAMCIEFLFFFPFFLVEFEYLSSQ